MHFFTLTYFSHIKINIGVERVDRSCIIFLIFSTSPSLWWVGPASCWVPQLLAHFPCQQYREEIRKSKSKTCSLRETLQWRNGVGENLKMMQIQSLTTPTSSLQPMTLTTSPKIPFPQFSLLSRVWNITSLCFLLDCVPTKLCAHPWPICYGEQSGERTCCSAVAKTPVCCQHCCGHKSKTQHPL